MLATTRITRAALPRGILGRVAAHSMARSQGGREQCHPSRERIADLICERAASSADPTCAQREGHNGQQNCSNSHDVAIGFVELVGDAR
eukprot:scaffold232997_cov33-Tisochrysis_lutea.AAC.7